MASPNVRRSYNRVLGNKAMQTAALQLSGLRMQCAASLCNQPRPSPAVSSSVHQSPGAHIHARQPLLLLKFSFRAHRKTGQIHRFQWQGRAYGHAMCPSPVQDRHDGVVVLCALFFSSPRGTGTSCLLCCVKFVLTVGRAAAGLARADDWGVQSFIYVFHSSRAVPYP